MAADGFAAAPAPARNVGAGRGGDIFEDIRPRAARFTIERHDMNPARSNWWTREEGFRQGEVDLRGGIPRSLVDSRGGFGRFLILPTGE